MANKNLSAEQLEAIKRAKELLNGCPLMDNRKKGDWDSISGKVIHIEEFFKMDNYYCITVKEYPENYFLTGQALTNLINELKELVLILNIEVGEKVKTKNNNTYRAFKIVD